MTETLEDIADQNDQHGNTRTHFGKKRGVIAPRNHQPSPLKRIIGGAKARQKHVKITLHTGPIK